MIVTLTINPTIDRVISVDRLAFEDRAYINSSHESAGGRGINASCVIHSFGGQTLAVLICGGDAGKRLQEHLQCDGLQFQVVPVEKEIRTNLTITDKHGLTVNLNEVGPTLSKAEVTRVEKAVKETLDRASWLMLCGSLPPGVPPSFYGGLIAAARKKKVKTLLHADGEALRLGVEERPTVATPNQQEAHAIDAHTLPGGGGADPRDGAGIGGALTGQQGRGGRVSRRDVRGAAAAGRRGVSHRRGRCAVGGLYVGDGAQG